MGKALDQLVLSAARLFWGSKPYIKGPVYWEPYSFYEAASDAIVQAPSDITDAALIELFHEDLPVKDQGADIEGETFKEVLHNVLQLFLVDELTELPELEKELAKRLALPGPPISGPSPALNPR